MNDQTKYEIFKQMFRIRAVEEEIAKKYNEGEMRCPVHLSIGQESIPAIFSQFVHAKDFTVSTHRGHAHYLSKGGNLDSMIAELYGKSSGCSKGKGGSMHLIDLNVNFMGTSAIVGNSIPVGVGLALSAQLKQTNQISIVFHGDGATEEGVFYESVNFAVIKNLPVIFICENNFFSVYSPLKVRQPNTRKISKMVEGLGIKTFSESSINLELASEKMKEAFQYTRNKNGPCFIEYQTYRWREHCGNNYDDDLGYREIAEVQYWKANDPLDKIEDYLINLTNYSNEIVKYKRDVMNEINNAFNIAQIAPFPEYETAFTDVYA